MHPFGLDLNLLVALDALLELKNVTRAGEKLHVTQSAMSGSLARLREYFDDPLLVPVGRRLEKTPLGEELARPVRELLQQVDGVLRTRPGFQAAASTRMFRVMASEYGSTVVVAEAMRRMRGQAPHVGVEVTPFADAPARALEDGEVDVLLIARQALAPDHPHEVLFTDGFACVGWSSNAALHEGLTIEQFLALGHVLVKYGQRSVPHIGEAFFASSGLHRRVEIVVASFSAVPQYLVETSRVAVMPRRLAEFYARTAPLKLVAPPVSLPPLEQCLQWNIRREQDLALAWFRAQLRAAAQELGDQQA